MHVIKTYVMDLSHLCTLQVCKSVKNKSYVVHIVNYVSACAQVKGLADLRVALGKK